MTENKGPLKGLRVFDMSRVLAGPSATQILGDLGADVIKIERPGQGDDTRAWGPPFLKDKDGNETKESAYYLSVNRNKKSLTLDYTKPEGLAIAKKLIATSDILFENYKTGSLDRHGLGYAQLKTEFPRLIYCSLTGFGHTGPYKNRAGYDYLIQGMSGVMSLNGPADGHPYKMPIAFADIMTGLYATIGILAALHHRDKTGQGQMIDAALLDSQIAVLTNVAQYYLTSGKMQPRMGNAHSTIVPYETFEAKDGYIILAVGNDRQFRDFCIFAEMPALATDSLYAKNQDRVRNREKLVPLIRSQIKTKTVSDWVKGLGALDVPCGPVNNIEQVFQDPQVIAREMTTAMPHPLSPDPVNLVSSPLVLSETPVSCRKAPPLLGEDTKAILKEDLNMADADIDMLKQKGVI